MKKLAFSLTSTLIIFALILTFFLPVKLNSLCKPNSPCPPYNSFIRITEVSTNPTFVSINYLFVIVELIISYVASILILKIYIILKKR